jgi:hypothetical protein
MWHFLVHTPKWHYVLAVCSQYHQKRVYFYPSSEKLGEKDMLLVYIYQYLAGHHPKNGILQL